MNKPTDALPGPRPRPDRHAGVCDLLAPSSPERPFQKGAEVSRLKDRSTLTLSVPESDGIDFPVLREPESLEMPSSYAPTGPAPMTAVELSEVGSTATPPAPRLQRFGEVRSHVGDRFVLGGGKDAYRIWRFRSADPPIEFPVTQEGWALAWSTFQDMERQAV